MQIAVARAAQIDPRHLSRSHGEVEQRGAEAREVPPVRRPKAPQRAAPVEPRAEDLGAAGLAVASRELGAAARARMALRARARRQSGRAHAALAPGEPR